MKKIIFDDSAIHLDCIDPSCPIFVKIGDGLVGMVVHDIPRGWIIRIGNTAGACGYQKTLKECLEKGQKFGYEYVTTSNHHFDKIDKILDYINYLELKVDLKFVNVIYTIKNKIIEIKGISSEL